MVALGCDEMILGGVTVFIQDEEYVGYVFDIVNPISVGGYTPPDYHEKEEFPLLTFDFMVIKIADLEKHHARAITRIRLDYLNDDYGEIPEDLEFTEDDFYVDENTKCLTALVS